MVVFLIVLIAAAVLQLIFPWWIIVVVAFVCCGIICKTGRVALWSPFFAIVVLWAARALFKSIPNSHILVSRVAAMLGLHSWWPVLLLTIVLGGFVAAISGFCGYHFRKAVLSKKTAL
jgi:hypothetical protein